jgi:BCD family chlorophyll transporter-like MFS transporter
MKFLPLASKTIRLSLIRIGIGWMFALLTFNFNRVSMVELGAMGLIVATLIGLHHFLSPFQVIWGRLADRYPLAGYRRTPSIVLSTLVGSLIFLALPTLAVGLGQGAPGAILLAFALLAVFGLAMAANGSAAFALIAEVTAEHERGFVVAVTHTVMIMSAIVAAGVAKVVVPEYSPEQMQFFYNLTPLIALSTTLLGVIGLERRITPEQHAELLRSAEQSPAAAPSDGFRTALRLLNTNRQVRLFFWFVLLAIMGVFLQDAILEPFGGEVFNMTLAETSSFTQIWGGGVLLGMLLIGIASRLRPLSKKLLATTGGLGASLGLGLVALSSAAQSRELLHPALVLIGFSVGMFNVGAMAMMMEMIVEGATGLYMGLWGMAQGLGNGGANVLGGALHSALIETHLLRPDAAYGLIFGLEALLMVAAVLVLRSIGIREFKGLEASGLTRVMALDTAT